VRNYISGLRGPFSPPPFSSFDQLIRQISRSRHAPPAGATPWFDLSFLLHEHETIVRETLGFRGQSHCLHSISPSEFFALLGDRLILSERRVSVAFSSIRRGCVYSYAFLIHAHPGSLCFLFPGFVFAAIAANLRSPLVAETRRNEVVSCCLEPALLTFPLLP